MSFIIQDWHWLLLGIALMAIELFVPTFAVLWFGLGACIVAVCLWLYPELSLSWQIFTWVIASSGFTFLWFKYFKPTMIDRTKAGIAKEAIVGEAGTVIKAGMENDRGTVRFTTAVLGNDEWPFICNEGVAIGEKVYIQDISGNTLIVTKHR